MQLIGGKSSQPQPRLGTRSPINRRGRKQYRYKCALGCRRETRDVFRHYQSKTHGLTKAQDLQFSKTKFKPLKSKTVHLRKHCSVQNWPCMTSRIADHLRLAHPNWTEEERVNFKLRRKADNSPSSLKYYAG